VKKYLIAIAVIFAFAFSANAAFASFGDIKKPNEKHNQIQPIPGVDIIVKKKPGNIAKPGGTTDTKGKFKTPMLTAGTYTIEFMKKDTSGRSALLSSILQPFNLQLDKGNKVTVNGKPIDSLGTISVTADTIIEITILKRDSTISGKLTADTTNK